VFGANHIVYYTKNSHSLVWLFEEISLLPGPLTETAGSYELNPGDKPRVFLVFDVSRIERQLVCWRDKRETTILEAHQFNGDTEII